MGHVDLPMTSADAVCALRREVAAFGPHFDLDILAATHALYRPHIAPLRAPALRDQPYGPHARHRLDLYLPDGPAQGLVVYVHGGGFVRGDKDLDGVFYANVGRFLTDAGFAAVLPNYRRAGEAGWPAGAQDVQAALQWVHAQRAQICARPLPVFVMGQSAGASHVASWFFDEAARGSPRAAVQGVLLMSGFYRASAPLAENIAAYFGDDARHYAERSPLSHARRDHTPLWLSVAEFDPGRIAAHTFALAERLTQLNGRSPAFAWLAGHNHVSTVLSLASPQRDAGDSILGFLRACLASPSTYPLP